MLRRWWARVTGDWNAFLWGRWPPRYGGRAFQEPYDATQALLTWAVLLPLIVLGLYAWLG